MTAQEHAPVVPVDQTGAAAPAPHGPAEHPVVAHLRFCLTKAEEYADDIAARGGREREIGKYHLAEADRYAEEAMHARVDVTTWEVLLERAIAEVSKPGVRQEAAPTGRAVTPDVQHEGGTTITMQRVCNGCGRSLGDINKTEMDAAMNGQPLPDVRGECPTCRPRIATPGLAS